MESKVKQASCDFSHRLKAAAALARHSLARTPPESCGCFSVLSSSLSPFPPLLLVPLLIRHTRILHSHFAL